MLKQVLLKFEMAKFSTAYVKINKKIRIYVKIRIQYIEKVFTLDYETKVKFDDRQTADPTYGDRRGVNN